MPTQQNTKLEKVQFKVDKVKAVMHENIEMGLQNCVRLENLEEKSEELMQDANVFRNNAKKLRQKMWWKNARIWFIGGGLAIIAIIILVCMVYYTTPPPPPPHPK